MRVKKSPQFSGAMKLPAVRRMLAGENVSALARELKVLRKDLYEWRANFRAGGPLALRQRGRPRKAATIEPVERRAWRDGNYAAIAAMTAPLPQGKLTVERLCALARVNRAECGGPASPWRRSPCRWRRGGPPAAARPRRPRAEGRHASGMIIFEKIKHLAPIWRLWSGPKSPRIRLRSQLTH